MAEKMSALEKRFAREERRSQEAKEDAAKRAERRQQREDEAQRRKRVQEMSTLLKKFRRLHPVEINQHGQASFTFRGVDYTISHTKWKLGGESMTDPDDYVTHHEGYKLHSKGGDAFGYVLWEFDDRVVIPVGDLNKPGSPTPEKFAEIVIAAIKKDREKRDEEYRRKNYNHFDYPGYGGSTKYRLGFD